MYIMLYMNDMGWPEYVGGMETKEKATRWIMSDIKRRGLDFTDGPKRVRKTLTETEQWIIHTATANNYLIIEEV